MWIWSRRRKAAAEDARRQRTEARSELEQARRDLARAEADSETVDTLAGKLVELKRRNHFGPMITRALRGSE